MKQRSEVQIIGDKVDLVLFIKGIRGLDVRIGKDSTTLIKRWRLQKAEKECKVVIKRFVNAEKFSVLLSLQRSEALKTGERVRFTNTDVRLVRDFVDALREIGIRNVIVYVYYSETKSDDDEVNKIIECLECMGLSPRKLYSYEKCRKPVIEVDVNNTALAAFLIHAERLFRKIAAKGRLPKNLVSKYARYILLGDGNIHFRKEDGSLSLRISEKDAEAANDIKRIFKRYYGITLHTYNQFEHVCSINTETLFTLLLDDVIPLEKYSEKIRKKLLLAYERKRLPWILINLLTAFESNYFSTPQASKVLQKARHHAREKLAELERKGYLESAKIKVNVKRGTPIRRLYRLTNKATRIVKLLLPLLFTSFLSTLISYSLSVIGRCSDELSFLITT